MGLGNFFSSEELFSNIIDVSYNISFLTETYEFKEKQLILKKFQNQLKIIKNTQEDDDFSISPSTAQIVLNKNHLIFLK